MNWVNYLECICVASLFVSLIFLAITASSRCTLIVILKIALVSITVLSFVTTMYVTFTKHISKTTTFADSGMTTEDILIILLISLFCIIALILDHTEKYNRALIVILTITTIALVFVLFYVSLINFDNRVNQPSIGRVSNYQEE